MNPSRGRTYKSRKQRPCDACRKRKICCIREPDDEACSLCRMQKATCKYESAPNPRKRRSVVKENQSPNSDTTSGSPIPANIESTSTEWISQFVGLSGDQDPFVLRHFFFDGSNYYRKTDWACLRVRNDGSLPLHFTIVPDSHLDARPPFYPSSACFKAAKPYEADLLKVYFETVHTSYPLLDPTVFEGKTTPSTLLAVIFALAFPFCPNASSLVSMDYNSFAFQALPIEARSPRLETIEAALLFLQRHTEIHRVPTTPGLWPEIGSLVGMSQEVGLNVDPSQWEISQAEKDRRIRLWWAVYMQDKWSALGLGRTSYIHNEDWSVPMVTVDNIPTQHFNGQILPQRSAWQFVGMAVLTTILGDVLSSLYSLKAIDRVSNMHTEALYGMILDFESRLDSFHDEYILPLDEMDRGIFLDPTGTIRLAYHTVQIVLYRALLRFLDPGDSIYLSIRSSSKKTLRCVSDLLSQLQVNRLRAFWWSPMSRINFAIASGFMFSLLLTSTTDTDIEYWTAEIAHYRQLLEMQSLSFDTTKLASIRMNLLANFSSQTDKSTLADAQIDPAQALYNGFGTGSYSDWQTSIFDLYNL